MAVTIISRAGWGAKLCRRESVVMHDGAPGRTDLQSDLPERRSLFSPSDDVGIVELAPASASWAAVVDLATCMERHRVRTDMSAAFDQLEVLKAVIGSVGVAMVDVITGRNRAVGVLPNGAVLVDDSPATSDTDVPVRVEKSPRGICLAATCVLAASLDWIARGFLGDPYIPPRLTVGAVVAN